jgi:hypothetical protein
MTADPSPRGGGDVEDRHVGDVVPPYVSVQRAETRRRGLERVYMPGGRDQLGREQRVVVPNVRADVHADVAWTDQDAKGTRHMGLPLAADRDDSPDEVLRLHQHPATRRPDRHLSREELGKRPCDRSLER